ncbi:MAG: glycerophosphodiester phosphodiesterase [Sphingomonadales bacterium]|nr:glycerophosphodiester phosphodiesterase [Sphingomonadales bacterium]MBD3774242.1 glycerophosphodiester phosphodiesterase [Paracoccaceae bacterium]
MTRARLKRIGLWVGFIAALGFLALTVLNASWLAPVPHGRISLIAHRGVYQAYDHKDLGRDTCTATRIEQPQHRYLENTLESLRQARALGAVMVELDIAPTADGQLAVFHDWTLDCRTDGHGDTRDATMAELKALDAGYGYTADGGKSFPFRGRGVGAIPSLAEYLAANGNRALMFNFKSKDAKEADMLAAALKAAGRDPVARGDGFYGGKEAGPVARMRELYPQAWVFSGESVIACTKAYAIQGWFGITPEACRGGTMMIPLNRQFAFAGWPNRAIARLEAVGARIVVVGPQGTGGPRGLDLPEQLGEVPSSFNGYVWVDDMWNLGPALHPSVERRSNADQVAAQDALERRRAARD